MSAVMNTQTAFRPMFGDDLDVVMRIERAAHAYPWTEGIFRDCLRVGYACRVLHRDEIILGYGIMSLAANECHLFNVCIDPQYQHQGFGRFLLDHLLTIAHEMAVESVFLEVRPSNIAALALYESAGFNQVGCRKDYYPAPGGREDGLILAKQLVAD